MEVKLQSFINKLLYIVYEAFWTDPATGICLIKQNVNSNTKGVKKIEIHKTQCTKIIKWYRQIYHEVKYQIISNTQPTYYEQIVKIW